MGMLSGEMEFISLDTIVNMNRGIPKNIRMDCVSNEMCIKVRL